MRCKQKLFLTLIVGFAALLAAKPGPARGRVSHEANVQVAAYYFPAWHKDALFPGKEGEWPALQDARPRFPGQRQPKVPLWGYQDESDPAVMAQKINAAVDHGVSIFLFDWYWHDRGKWKGTVLDSALNDGFLKAPNRSRMKFALMWANHDVGDSPGPIGRAGFDTMTDHIVQDYFSSSSYLKINGRCYFSIYVLSNFIEGLGGVEEAKAALDSFRKKAAAAGFGGIYLNAIDYGIPKEQPDIIKRLGIDSVTSYVWVHKVHLDSFPETDYRLTGDNISITGILTKTTTVFSIFRTSPWGGIRPRACPLISLTTASPATRTLLYCGTTRLQDSNQPCRKPRHGRSPCLLDSAS